jgi:hypothetical protein
MAKVSVFHMFLFIDNNKNIGNRILEAISRMAPSLRLACRQAGTQ